MSSAFVKVEVSTPVVELPVTEGAADAKTQSYNQILKSSAVIGGSQLLTIAIGVVRIKAMAVMLGPSGVGLAGLYGSIADLTVSIAGMGLNSSGVRQIAEANGSNDRERMARTAAVLRRASILFGALGAVLLAVFSWQASTLTFGSNEQAGAVALLSIAVFCRVVSAGQGALIQGMRYISAWAKINVLGALFGTLLTVPLVYFYRGQGVVPSLVAIAAMSLMTSWWYSRKIQIKTPSMTASEMKQEGSALLKLGFAFMTSGLMMMGSAYAVRIIVLHKVGFEATGLYQSAWTLGGLYVGFILQAMGADFYPRLTACGRDNLACNRLVNQQTRVGLLLAGPGLIATLTFAPLVIGLFYSTSFGGAVEVLRWICIGVALRVITWPIGYIIVARGEQALFFWSELAWTIVNISLTWICVSSFGLKGAGIAFFGTYIFHGLLVYPIVSRLSHFRWSAENRHTGLLFLLLVAVVFWGFVLLPFGLAAALGSLAAVLSGAYSIRVLLTLLSFDQIPRPVGRLLVRLGFVPCY